MGNEIFLANVGILIEVSVYLRSGNALEYGSSQFHPVHRGDGSIVWHLCDRHVHGPDIHHRQYPHYSVAPIRLWLRLLAQGHHEQCVSRIQTPSRREKYHLIADPLHSMGIIIRIITGALQDADDNSYRRVVQVYLFLAAGSLVVGSAILVGSFMTDNLGLLQWTRQKRLSSGAETIQGLKERSLVAHAQRTRRLSIGCFAALLLLIIGGWVAYIWGAVTGHNS